MSVESTETEESFVPMEAVTGAAEAPRATGLSSPAQTPTIHVENLDKTYVVGEKSTVDALQGVSLTLNAGEFTSIVGASGCGKSTLMMIIAGLLDATAGTVEVSGKAVTKPQAEMGVVFQRDVLLAWRTVLGNVMIQAEARRMDRKSAKKHARELLTQMGLSGFEDVYPDKLSGGMRQRVSICRALLHNPDVLLMDEPFGALDALTRDQMGLDLLKIWARDRKTVFFVTHDIREAVYLSDRVVVMTPRPGRIDSIVEIDLPRPRHLDVRETPEFNTYVKQITDSFLRHGVLHE